MKKFDPDVNECRYIGRAAFCASIPYGWWFVFGASFKGFVMCIIWLIVWVTASGIAAELEYRNHLEDEE